MQFPLFVQCDTCASWLISEDFPLVKPGFQKKDAPRQSTCWTCRDRQWKARWRHDNPKPRKRVDPEMFHFCQTCQRWKAADLFSWPMRLSQVQELTCFKCQKQASDRRWQEPRRKEISRKNGEYTRKHWHLIYPKHLAWRAKNIVRIREVEHARLLKNLASSLARLKAWADKHPDRIRANTKRRAAQRRGAKGYYTFAQLQARIAYYGWKCWICGAPYEAIDHVKPIKVGGSNWPSNLRPICTKCNSLKSWLWPIPQRILDRRYQPPD